MGLAVADSQQRAQQADDDRLGQGTLAAIVLSVEMLNRRNFLRGDWSGGWGMGSSVSL